MDCGIRTDDPMVSRYHARILYQGGSFSIEDLKSANGMFFDEQRVTRHVLHHGDAVRCGSLWLRFVDPNAPAQPSTPAQIEPQKPASKPEKPPPSQQSNQADQEEIRRLRRRIDQLQAELRMYRGGGAKALQIEELQQEHRETEEERDRLKKRVQELEGQIKSEGADAKVQRADQIRDKASNTVSQLNDLLSDLRINVTAAEGEFDLFADAIPRASFELIREALRSAARDLDKTRELVRELRQLSN